MLWRRHAFPPSLPIYPHRLYSTKTAEPLRILFCGSDEFSITSLRALDDARQKDAGLIESIEVVHRPGKRTGRGLKVIREVPIKQHASHLHLPTHELDTFTNWTPPVPINLIIAVSFGLLVPPRILSLAKYGGLNVHPSLLPDFRGAAPIHHTLLQARSHTGLSIQTLHPKHFDHGTILAQTPAPGIPIPPQSTPMGLTQTLAPLGASLLLDVLKSRAFVPPLEDRGWYTGPPVSPAPKITKKDSGICFATMGSTEVLHRHHVLGDLWGTLQTGERIVMHSVHPTQYRCSSDDGLVPQEGQSAQGEEGFYQRCSDGAIVVVEESTVAGGKRGGGRRFVERMIREDDGEGRTGWRSRPVQ
ncbi:methionyl-tRNA formyltransferase [Amniculicola lignicola CBS 123094]|uniref:methionyl-tRNA formyltransferase n=1 Tax=Amniculicola lignicola CBS 123094 TaxID=1392246 RepID=A0A6A5WLV1_9PLEO|nr:methionyl-tRNA formyltransferase [Amniculicola lignicola CBS 123094]